MSNIFWKVYTQDDRTTAIGKVQELVAPFGDIVDHHIFSDLAISIRIELEECHVDALHARLQVHFLTDPIQPLNSNSTKERTVYLHLHFGRGSGNLRTETPDVPG